MKRKFWSLQDFVAFLKPCHMSNCLLVTGAYIKMSEKVCMGLGTVGFTGKKETISLPFMIAEHNFFGMKNMINGIIELSGRILSYAFF